MPVDLLIVNGTVVTSTEMYEGGVAIDNDIIISRDGLELVGVGKPVMTIVGGRVLMRDGTFTGSRR